MLGCTQLAVHNGVTHGPQTLPLWSNYRLTVTMMFLGHNFHVTSSSDYN